MKHKPKSTKVYFNNAEITPAILEYQKLHDSTHLTPYTTNFTKLIRGIINTHKIYRFWPDSDELVQQGFVVVLEALNRFDIKKGDLFSYLSIALKNALKNWTITQNSSINKTLEYKEEIYEKYTSEAITYDIVELTSVKNLTKEEEKLCVDIDIALNKHKINNYQDLVAFLQSNGWKSPQIANCLHILRSSYEGRRERA